MTGKLDRLKIRADFLRVAAARCRVARPGLVLQAAPHLGGRDEPWNIRVGFTASRRVGNAVIRNRAKRRLREAAARVLPHRGRRGTDYVLIARQGTVERPFPALLADLETALRQIESGRPRGHSGSSAEHH